MKKLFFSASFFVVISAIIVNVEKTYIFKNIYFKKIFLNPLKVNKYKIPLVEGFTYKLLSQNPIVTPGGTVRIVDSTYFPISKTIAAALVEIKPGGMREMHWHPNNDEWQYYLTGKGRMTVFGGSGNARIFNYRAGDIGYVPFAFGHYIENIGETSLWFLEIFKSNRFQDVSLNQWMALTPHELVKENLM